MTCSGQACRILLVFAQIIVVIFILHILILVYQLLIAGEVVCRNLFRLLLNMLPAYLMALGTTSSSAMIPVTLSQSVRNGLTE